MGEGNGQRQQACQWVTLGHWVGHSMASRTRDSAFSIDGEASGCTGSPERTSITHTSLLTGKIQGNSAFLG